jgi:hypothetical protein
MKKVNEEGTLKERKNNERKMRKERGKNYEK